MGLSPYDKKSYKESKRRRRQALLQSETGYIMPYKRSKKPLIIILGIVAAVCLCVAALITFRIIQTQPAQKETKVTTLSEEEKLWVVNRLHPLTPQDTPPLTELDGILVHTAIADDLNAFLQAASEQGITLKLTKGYVSYEEQKSLYEANLAQFQSDPAYTPVRAQAAAQRIVPEPGCCESQTGMLVQFDVGDSLTKAFVERECINYGFILRYPDDKEDITHIQPSNAYYRYVGAEHAEKMRAFGMCLEEYAEYLQFY